jgi:hypothetical protein
VPRQPKKLRIPGFVLLIGAALLVAVGVGFYVASINRAPADPAHLSQQDVDSLVGTVGKLILLPAETPTIATVTDLNALKDQAFFTNARVGDKVLMFPKSKRAILYDPQDNKIIEVGPITVTGQ